MISVIIPTKNEPLLDKTIADIRENAVGDIEILTEEDPGIGQRALMNKLAKQAKGDYIMKTDAHCSFGPGFDEIMQEEIEDDMVLMPLLYPLDPNLWTINHHNPMSSYVFDTNLVMHFADHDPSVKQNESMCVQGSCFMTKTDNYWNWNLADDSLGSWGHQAAEVGIKAWINGGRCVTTHKTYYGHVFRHSEEEFPYERKQEDIDATHEAVQKLKTAKISDLVQKFKFPADWDWHSVIELEE